MNAHICMGALLVGMTLAVSVHATDQDDQSTVLIFTTTEISVSESDRIASTTYELDMAQTLIDELGRDLPGELERAKQAIAKRMNSESGQVLMSRLRK